VGKLQAKSGGLGRGTGRFGAGNWSFDKRQGAQPELVTEEFSMSRDRALATPAHAG
jgi:hypothetical protein